MNAVSVPSRVVQRYAQDYDISMEQASRHFDELVGFLEICASTPERCAPSEAMDEVWHTFIQFTREYREFCLSNFGYMIDHDPSPRTENIEPYIRTRKLAETRFDKIDPLFWPIGAAGATMCGANRCDANIN